MLSAKKKKKEAQHQQDRRQKIRELRNVGSSFSNIISKNKDIEDTVMDEEVEEEKQIQGDSGAHSNKKFNPNHRFYSYDEIKCF